jgi:hypothetical protein
MAHEIGHYVKRHCGGDPALQDEIEANAMAIKVLQVWGESEQEAVRHVENQLRGLIRRGTLTPGHDYAAELTANPTTLPPVPMTPRPGPHRQTSDPQPSVRSG